MKYIMLFLFFLLINLVIAQNSTIENYVKIGLKNNIALQEKEFSVQQGIADLKKARGMFFPSIDIKSRYSRADGGRDIDILVGDLVNPMQNALNSINPQFGFPANIPNVKVPFLRKEEQETKVNLIQPIIQPALFYNYSILNNLLEIKSLEKQIFTRGLISEIKISYLNILRTREVVKLFENTMLVLDENLRINNSLFKNDKITIDKVHRAKAEKSEIEHKLLEAENNYSLAKSYFNYLLNRPLDDEVTEENFETENLKLSELAELELSAENNREEFRLVKKLVEISEDKGSAVQTSFYPGLSLAVDYGYQGEKYNFSSKDDYWMASLVFNWNIFNGFQDEAKAERAQIETKKSLLQLAELANKIRLQVREAYNNYSVSQEMIKTANDQLSSSKQSFRLIERKYKEGLSSQIEYLDSQNQLLQSSISKIIAEYNLLENFAKLEQVTASIDLVKYYNNQWGLE